MSHVCDELSFSKEHLLVFWSFVVEAEEALFIGLFDSHDDDEFGSDAKSKDNEMLHKIFDDFR